MASLRSAIAAVTTALILLLSARLCRCQDNVMLADGDVTLGAMFTVNNQQDAGCGEYDVASLKELMAVKWFVHSLNAIDYVPGVRIGLDVYRTCQSAELATRVAVNMLEKYRVLSDDPQDINSTVPLFGLVGPDRTQEAIDVARFLSSLPATHRPVLISGSATGSELIDRGLYSNFYRVIPPDSTQVQVLLKLLQELGWNYVSIVYDRDAYGQQAAQQLKELAIGQGICVPSFRSLPLDHKSTEFIDEANSIILRLRGDSDESIITGVVYIGGASTARQFVGLLAATVSFVRFVFSEALGLQTSVVSGTAVGKGALAAAPPSIPLPEFKTYWNNIWTDSRLTAPELRASPWLGEYYTTTTSCTIGDDSCRVRVQDQLPLIQGDDQWSFEYYQVKAAAVLALLLKRMHAQECGQGHRGVCLALKQQIRENRGMIEASVQSAALNLENEFLRVSSIFKGQTNVGFDSQGEITSGEHNGSVYNVFNYRECSNNDFCFQQVATYKVDGRLELDTGAIKGYDDSGQSLSWPDLTKAQCREGFDCLECLPPDIPGEMVLVPGDYYIVSVAPVHDRQSNKPLQCGAIRTSSGADLVQSIMFAVEQVNRKNPPFSGIFGSKTLGVLIFNSCNRELVIKDRLIEFHKGALVLPDGRNSSAILPYIAGYVGTFFSTIGVAMYEVLASLNTRFVMVSGCNTSPELSDRVKYPYYMRLTTGQDTQVEAILSLVREMGHSYVQVIYDPKDIYTQIMKERINILSSTKPYNICVVNNIETNSEDQSFYQVLDDLRKNLWAPVVVVILQSKHASDVFDDILPQMTAADKFLFIGTDAWARSQGVLASSGAQKLLGALAFSVELPLNQLFGEELKKTDPLKTSNPWLKYFWEAGKQCYFEGSFRRNRQNGQCSQDLTRDYVQDLWVPFYINAVYAFALGLDSAMTRHCQEGFLCDTLTSQELVDALKEVKLDLFNNGIKENVFDSNGDGDLALKLFQISASGNTFEYTDVGRYDHGSLTMNKDEVWAIQNVERTQCPNPRTCDACFPPLPAQQTMEEDDSALIATIVVIVILVIVIAVLVVLLVLSIRRLRAKGRADQKIAFDNLGSDTRVNSRPLPPTNDSAGGFSHTSRESNRNSASGSVMNTYDYLQYQSDGSAGSTDGRSRHAYEQPMHGQPRFGNSMTGSGSGGVVGGYSGGDSGVGSAVNVGRPMSRQPQQPIAVDSEGYVVRQSPNVLPYELALNPAEGEGQLGSGGGSGGYVGQGGVIAGGEGFGGARGPRRYDQLATTSNGTPPSPAAAGAPIVFQNDIPDLPVAPRRPHPTPPPKPSQQRPPLSPPSPPQPQPPQQFAPGSPTPPQPQQQPIHSRTTQPPFSPIPFTPASPKPSPSQTAPTPTPVDGDDYLTPIPGDADMTH